MVYFNCLTVRISLYSQHCHVEFCRILKKSGWPILLHSQCSYLYLGIIFLTGYGTTISWLEFTFHRHHLHDIQNNWVNTAILAAHCNLSEKN